MISEIVKNALELARKKAARNMCRAISDELESGPDHEAYNTPERAERVLLNIEAAIAVYKNERDALNAALK